jgi:outer membrane protein OmpA-like peptidoglycan-associated protein
VTSIGSSAFKASALTTLVIPSSVTSIGSSAFRNSPLTSLTINSTSLTVGSSAFNATAVSNLTCFYNLGNAVISSTTLQSAVLPPACPVVAPTPTVPAPTPAPTPTTPVITQTPEPTPSASPTPSPTASPTQDPTPLPADLPAVVTSFRIAGFAPGSSVLNSKTTQALAKQVGKLTRATLIVVTGFSQGPHVLKSDYALSISRAKAVRAQLQSVLGKKVRINIASKQTTQVGSHYRAVQIAVVK